MIISRGFTIHFLGLTYAQSHHLCNPGDDDDDDDDDDDSGVPKLPGAVVRGGRALEVLAGTFCRRKGRIRHEAAMLGPLVSPGMQSHGVV
jgi:hypothetical protein